MFDSLASLFDWGSSDTVVPNSNSNQLGNGNYSSDLIGNIIKAGTGLAGAFMTQSSQRQALDQSSKQADDQYKMWQEQMAFEKETAGAKIALAKKQMMMDAYKNYSNTAMYGAGQMQQSFGKVGTDMASAALMRAR